jgi:hypothetical protein
MYMADHAVSFKRIASGKYREKRKELKIEP